MSSFVSKTIGRIVLPNLERDLTRVVNEGVRSSATMTDCFLAPVVYGFRQQQGRGGIGRATSALEQRRINPGGTTTVQKIHYPALPKGLFR